MNFSTLNIQFDKDDRPLVLLLLKTHTACLTLGATDNKGWAMDSLLDENKGKMKEIEWTSVLGQRIRYI